MVNEFNNAITDNGEGQEHSINEDVEFLGGDDENVDEVPPEDDSKQEDEETNEDEEKTDEDKEKNDEENEDDEEKESKDDEETEIPTALRRPKFSEITAKYPDFFKDFPDMRHMMGREKEYTQVFPSVQDAKDAAEKIQDYDYLDELVTAGEPTKISEFLNIIKDNDENVYNGFLDNFLDGVRRASEDKYAEITMPVIEHAIRYAYDSGIRNNNKNLQLSAQHIAQCIFGDPDIATGKKTTIKPKEAPKKDEESEKFNKEKSSFYQERQAHLNNEVQLEIQKSFMDEIEDGLDPNNNMSAYLKGKIADDILSAVDAQMQKDPEYMRLTDRLFERAKKEGFPISYKQKYVTAYLARARELMPEIRKRIKAKVVGRPNGSGKKKSSIVTPSGATPRSSSSNYDAKKIDWGKTSDLDILNDEVTLKS